MQRGCAVGQVVHVQFGAAGLSPEIALPLRASLCLGYGKATGSAEEAFKGWFIAKSLSW